MTVNKERVQLLIDALRSGEYKQGYGTLEYKGGGGVEHCCLGVACRVAMQNGLELSAKTLGGGSTIFTDSNGHQEFSVLPKGVRDWYGFEGLDPYLTADFYTLGSKVPSTTANDKYELTFSAIADAFQRTYIDVGE